MRARILVQAVVVEKEDVVVGSLLDRRENLGWLRRALNLIRLL